MPCQSYQLWQTERPKTAPSAMQPTRGVACSRLPCHDRRGSRAGRWSVQKHIRGSGSPVASGAVPPRRQRTHEADPPAKGQAPAMRSTTGDTLEYMLFHCVDESIELSSELAAEIDASTAAWVEQMTRDGVDLHGAYLRPVRDATTVRVRGGEVLIADGPFAETREQIGGYDVIECADLDTAIAVAARHPVARIGAIEVRPVLRT
jgi:hypothetical protein